MFVMSVFRSQQLTEAHAGQFWRIHSSRHLKQYGEALKIGRTQNVPNRFDEPKRSIGIEAGM